jgi:hypothetical protein
MKAQLQENLVLLIHFNFDGVSVLSKARETPWKM